MRLPFSKYHGTGNDFIVIDGGQLAAPPGEKLIALLCHRHFGIGADGLIVVNAPTNGDIDYLMDYYNADGKVGSMCGNGARCAFHFAQGIGLAGAQAVFLAFDGRHTAESVGKEIAVSMRDVTKVTMPEPDSYVLNTGSPHYIQFLSDVESLDIFQKGREIRNRPAFVEQGINVNFTEVRKESIRVRTYERGVEDVTMSCGTGVTAAALAFATKNRLSQGPVKIVTDGGSLVVDFVSEGDIFTRIRLIGPAVHVFDAHIDTDAFLAFH